MIALGRRRRQLLSEVRYRGMPLAGLLGAVLVVSAPTGGSAQRADWGAGAGVRLETYTFASPEDVNIESVSLFSFPLEASMLLSRSVLVEVESAFASARLKREDSTESTLSGLTDTELRVTLRLADDRVGVTGIGLVPTGKAAFSPEELDVAGVLAADVLPFSLTRWGTGGGVGLSTAFTQPVGAYALGASIGYVVAAEYEPLRDSGFAYRPGDQLHVRAAVDRTFGTSGKVALSGSLQHFREDRLDGANLYQSGDRLQLQLTYAFAAGARASGIGYGGYLRRGAAEETDFPTLAPAQDLFFVGGGLRIPAGVGVIRPALTLRLVQSEVGRNEGITLTGGASAEWPLRRVVLVPSLQGRIGRLQVHEGADSGLLGISLGLAVRLGRRAP